MDAAVAKSLESVPVPSMAVRAYEAVRGSVVRVRAFYEGPDGGEFSGGIGTGVVILDKGVILTNVHVVDGAHRISVAFADGFEADADLTGTRPEDDLAVLQAKAVPDDLQPATIQSTAGLSLAITSRPSASRSASGPRCPRASSRASGANSARRRAGACSRTSSSSMPP